MRNNMNIRADFSELAEFIGSFEGWSERVKTPYHMSELLSMAHGVASKQFDREAAVSARALGFTHMYEWGTVGINDSGDAPPLNPTTRAARLWNHRLTGSGTNRGIDFTFRPSVVDVPMPNDTGEASGKQLPRRRHKFAARPWVTEFGLPVVIKPRYAQALFIPRDSVGAFDNPRAETRGYMMFPHPVRVPGSPNAGNFQQFWHGWWNTEGRNLINKTTQDVIDGEVAAVVKTGRGRGNALSSYAGGKSLNRTFQLQVANAKAKAYAQTKANEANLQAWQREEFEDNIGAL